MHHRFAEKIPGHPLYLYLTHHAVWADLDGRLIDVTPYPDARHRPITTVNDPLFLVDDTARPIAAGGQPAPLPSRFFAIDDGPELAAYLAELNRKEREACEKLYASAGTSATSR